MCCGARAESHERGVCARRAWLTCGGGRYALNAVNSGSTSVGIRASNGVVIATEKKLPYLMDETSLEKVSMLTKDIGVVYSGAFVGCSSSPSSRPS